MKLIQIPVGGFDNNFSYILVGKNNEGVIIDTTGSIDIINKVIKENEVRLIGQLLTHTHHDHIELVDYFKENNVPLINFSKITNNPYVFEEKEIVGVKIEAVLTPGHLHDATCFLIGPNLITGDTLFVKGVGTTAYGGNEKELLETLTFLSTLNKELIIWPGHNYGGQNCFLKDALEYSNISPSKKVLDELKRKIEQYEKFRKQ